MKYKKTEFILLCFHFYISFTLCPTLSMTDQKINVIFRLGTDENFVKQLPVQFTFNDIVKAFNDIGDIKQFRVIVNTKEMNQSSFAELKQHIKDGTTIVVVRRLIGGLDLADLELCKKDILSNTAAEFNNLTVKPGTHKCRICEEKMPCVKYCCNIYLCQKCFAQEFHRNNLQIKCLGCNRIISCKNVFKNPTFLDALDNHDANLRSLRRNVDFCICKCGTYAINETMYSQQQCQKCKQWMCAFCNKDWGGQMKNQLYTCTVNCVWETMISYQLVPLNSRFQQSETTVWVSFLFYT